MISRFSIVIGMPASLAMSIRVAACGPEMGNRQMPSTPC